MSTLDCRLIIVRVPPWLKLNENAPRNFARTPRVDMRKLNCTPYFVPGLHFGPLTHLSSHVEYITRTHNNKIKIRGILYHHVTKLMNLHITKLMNELIY